MMPSLKNCRLVILFFVLSTQASPPLAGGLDGGGGNAIICRYRNQIKSVELLDLFEARKFHGLSIIKSQEPFLKQAQRVAEKGNPSQHLVSTSDLELTAKSIHLKSDLSLTPVNDSYHLGAPKNCAVVQVAVYRERALYINKEIWDLLDETNRAALLLHESIYTRLRIDHGETNSIRTRRIVGALLAGTSIENPRPEKLHSQIPDDPRQLAHVACASEALPLPGTNEYAFLLYPIPGFGDRFLIQFFRINGQDVLTYTHGEFSLMEARGDEIRLNAKGNEPEEYKGEDLGNLFSIKPEGNSRIMQRASVRFEAKSVLGSQPIELIFERTRSRGNQETPNFNATIAEVGTPRKAKIQQCAYIPSEVLHSCSPRNLP